MRKCHPELVSGPYALEAHRHKILKQVQDDNWHLQNSSMQKDQARGIIFHG